ncbi:hypothetical protein ACS5NO_12720 [Larkinella sp. GY13]|uniref:hypothetical protein n=1 Tax=Larkinella sp. GY13 TaxID=3453720 RepID=UPI003EEBC66D
MKAVKIIFGLSLIMLSALVTQATGNVVAGVAVIPAVSYGVQALTGFALFDGSGLALGALAALKKPKQGVANPGGGRRLFLAPIDMITTDWPTLETIVDGELATAPTMSAAVVGPPAVAAGTFVEVQVSDNSLKIDHNMKGASGYQSWEHAIEVKIAGYSKEQCAAIEKLLNQEVVAVATLNDGQRQVVGASFSGLQFEITHTSGAKGSDRREWTLKAKQDGYMFGCPILADTVTLPGIV